MKFDDLKNEILFSNGINFNDLPNWQKRGIGLYWIQEERTGYNPKEKVEVKVMRNIIKIDYELPMKDDYIAFIASIIETATQL
jgi:tRNA(His) guanylyltransferase